MFHKLQSKIHNHVQHSQASNQLKSGIYFANWSVYARKHFVQDLPAEHLTHVFYAFIGMDTNTGKVKFTDEWCDIQMPLDSINGNGNVTGSLQQLYQLKQRNRKLKVIMSIGGWGTSDSFTAIMGDASKARNFLLSSIAMVKEYGFDGIDIDWEYPRNKTEARQLVKLLYQLRVELHSFSPSMVLTFAAPGGDDNIQILDLKQMDQYLSFWNVMCYDFNGSGWSSKTGYHSNLFGSNGDNNLNCADIIGKYTKSGIPSNKLMLGMPLYARTFELSNASNPGIGQPFTRAGGEGTADYKKLATDIEKFDSRKVSAYSYNPSNGKWSGYDNPQSARIKAQWSKLSNLAGGFWWDSAGDEISNERSLVKNYVDQLGGIQSLDTSLNHLDYPSTFLKPLQ